MQRRTSKSVSKGSVSEKNRSMLSADEESELDDLILMEEVKLDLPTKSKKRKSVDSLQKGEGGGQSLQRKGTPEFVVPEAGPSARTKITFSELDKLPTGTADSKASVRTLAPDTPRVPAIGSSSSTPRIPPKTPTAQEELEELEDQKQQDAKIEVEMYTQRNSMRLVEIPEIQQNPESNMSASSISTGPAFPELSNTVTLAVPMKQAPSPAKPPLTMIPEEQSRPIPKIESESLPEQERPQMHRPQAVTLPTLNPQRISGLTAGMVADPNQPVVCRVVTKYPLKNLKTKQGVSEYFAVVIRDNWGECTAFLYDALSVMFVDLEVGNVLVLREFEVRKGTKTKGKGAVPFDLIVKKEGQATILEDEWDADVEQWLGPEVPVELKLIHFESLITKYEKEAGEFDVLVIIADISNEVQVPTKAGTFLPRRVLKVIDDSRYEAELTIWGILKGLETLSVGDVVVFRSVRLSIFRGRNISSGNHTKLLKAIPRSCPRLEEIRKLRDAYLKSLELGETVLDIKSLKDSMFIDSEIRSLKDILRASAGLMSLPEDATKVFCCVAYIRLFRGRCTYDKCPTKGCLKKVVVDSLIKDLLLCATCGPITGKKPEAKYIGEVELIDASNSIRATFANG